MEKILVLLVYWPQFLTFFLLEFDSRREYFKTQQKNWIEAHQSQKEQEREREKFEEKLYAQQVLEVTRMR